MSETAKALKINRTTLLRLLHTLEAEGFVERRPGGAGYQVGLSLLEVGARAIFSQDLVQVAVPVLTRLAEDLAALGASRRARRHRRALSRAPHAEHAARQQHPRRQPAAGACHHHGPHDPRLHAAGRDRAALCRQGARALQRPHLDHAAGAASEGGAGPATPASPGATPISSPASARPRWRCSISPARRSARSTSRVRSARSRAKSAARSSARSCARRAWRFPAVSAGSAPMRAKSGSIPLAAG